MANLFSGALGDLLCGIRAKFKSVYGADIEKLSRRMYNDITGRPCYGDVNDIDFEQVDPTVLMVWTSPCPDYSSSNPDPQGAYGDKGGEQFVMIPMRVAKAKPLVVLIEEVGNIIHFPNELQAVMVGLQDDCDMTIHAALVSMQQYGDIEHCWRVMIVAISNSLGEWAKNFRIPLGSFSHSVSYCAADVATPTEDIPERFKRHMDDQAVECRSDLPGELQKVAQVKPGHGYSTHPYAKYSLGGQPPKCTTYGAGRHEPLGTRRGDRSKVSYMFTPDDVCRGKNFSESVIEFYRDHYYDADPSERLGLTEDQFLFKCFGNGFTMRFGEAWFEAIHSHLQLAGVPFDIETTAVNDRTQKVEHVFKKEPEELKAMLTSVERVGRQFSQSLEGIQDGKWDGHTVYTFCLDTGATEMLCWDEQDKFLTSKRPAHAYIQGAKNGSTFNATSRGILSMGCFLKPEISSEAGKAKLSVKKRDRADRMRDKMSDRLDGMRLLEVDVVTAPREHLRKQLAGFPLLYEKFGMNLDLRQADKGISCMWTEISTGNKSQRWEVPLRWNGRTREWCFDYVPINQESDLHRELMARRYRDLQILKGYESMVEAQKFDMSPSEIGAFVLDMTDAGLATRMTHAKLPDDFDALMEALPKDKKLEVVYSRHGDDRSVRAVKNQLGKKQADMTEEQFHKEYGHLGPGGKCPLCAIIKGCMRWIYKVVDKYRQEKCGYYWDLDIFTVKFRSACGVKYYAGMRDRASQAVKIFSLCFKRDFIPQFKRWVTRQRRDPIYQVYNWNFCTIIKADNDGVWMRKSQEWLDVIEELGIQMCYTDKDRKETNCRSERLMGLMGSSMKTIMWAQGLPPQEHVDAMHAVEFLMNRFPTISVAACDPPDGDIARPLEQLTHGFISRQEINEQLRRFVMPGTLVLMHKSGVKNGDTATARSEWVVAKRMLGRQLIVYSPWTGNELKIDSYTTIDSPQGTHWRDQLGIAYVKPTACEPLRGDEDQDAWAKENDTFIDLAMPEDVKAEMKKMKIRKPIEAVKHVDAGVVQKVTPPDVEHLKALIDTAREEGRREAINQLHDSGLEGPLQDEPPLPSNLPEPEFKVVPAIGEIMAPTDLSEVIQEQKRARVEERSNQDGAKMATFDEGEDFMPLGERQIGKPNKPFVPRTLKEPNQAGSFTKHASKKADSRSLLRKMQQINERITFVKGNPKKVGSVSAKRFDKYKDATTINDMMAKGASWGDVCWDYDRKFFAFEEADPELGGLVAGDEVAIEANAMDACELKKEWKAAIRRKNVVIDRLCHWYWVCKHMHVPEPYWGVYYNWVLQASGGEITKEKLGDLTRSGSIVQPSLVVPAPTGVLWSEMIVAQNKAHHPTMTILTKEVREAEHYGLEVIKALDAYVRNEEQHRGTEVEANASKVRAKDSLPGVTPPPKGVRGVYKIDDAERREKFVAAMAKEISALTDMGTISHMHTKGELLEKFGVDIEKVPSVPTLMVLDNKFPDGETDPTKMTAKARLCIEGTPKQMQQGVHYDSVYAATPGQDSIMFFSALVVHLHLERLAFDVGNAYGWGKQDKKLALDYPRSLEQYNSKGEKLYMCLLKNTYGKPDGANLWYKERDGFWLDFFNDPKQAPGWSCRQFIMEQTLFEFTYNPYDVAQQGDSDMGESSATVYLLAWSDDCDCAGTSMKHIEFIRNASHNRWKVKTVSADFMLGVRRTLTVDTEDGEEEVWKMTLTQEEYIDGVVRAWWEHVVVLGLHKKPPDTPVPKGELLSVEDDVPEEESKAVQDRGYKAICGNLIWVSRFAHKEIAQGISVACRVMSKPSEKAWRHCMQMVAWLKAHKKRGVRFTSNADEHGLMAVCDASNKPDPKDGKCQHGNAVHWKGGPIAAISGKLTLTGWGSPANEHMALRHCAAKVMFFRNLFREMGLSDEITEPTKVYCDNNTAIHWVKTGKITEGNQYLQLAYHQTREWESQGHICVKAVHTKDNFSDLMTKPCSKEEYKNFLEVFCGYKRWEIQFARETMTFT